MLLEASRGAKGKVIDLDTGREVPKVRWLNLDVTPNALEAYAVDDKGRIKKEDGHYVTYTARGRFAFVPREVRTDPIRVEVGAAKCSLCPSVLTLPGDDLCPSCRARERGQRHNMRVDRLLNPLLDHKCNECSRLAEFVVSDEVIVSPVMSVAGRLGYLSQKKVAWERGMTVGRRWYCSWCFKPPRLVDPKGEIIADVPQPVKMMPG